MSGTSTSTSKPPEDGPLPTTASQHMRQVVATAAGTAAGTAASVAAGQVPAMGLSGVLAQWGNVSALVLGGFLFWKQFDEMARNAREDRSIARETMQQLRQDSDRHYEQMRLNDERQTAAMRQLTFAIEKLSEKINKIDKSKPDPDPDQEN